MALDNTNNQSLQGRYGSLTEDLQSIRPFKIYKTWNLGATDYVIINPTSGSISIYDAKANFNLDNYNEHSIGVLSGSVWYSIRALFYGRMTSSDSGTLSAPDGGTTFPAYYDEFRIRNLSGSALVFSIPQSKFGEGIQLLTFNFVSSSYNIVDDGAGDLFDLNASPGIPINLMNTTSSIGNISYDKGLVIITSQSYYSSLSQSMLVNTSSIASAFNYTSYYTSHECEYICPVKSYQFNGTLNPTAYTTDANGIKVFRFADIFDPSGSLVDFKPLATGIALYDNTDRAVVVAKFAKPIRIENDLDSIFIVRFDM